MSIIESLASVKGAAKYKTRSGDSFIIPTGSFAIDYGLLPKGGIPTGSMVQLSGWESSGKTTLAMNTAKNALDAGGIVVLKDTEHWEDYRMRQIGIDVDKYKENGQLIQLKDDRFMEEYFSTFIKMLDEVRRSKDPIKIPILFILDSVALTSTESQYENVKAGKEAPIAIRARVLSGALSVMEDYVSDLPVSIIFVNQFRTAFETRGYRTIVEERVTGGNAIKYAGHLHISLRAKKDYELNDLVVGKITEAKLEKNKVGFPNRKIDMLSYFNGTYGDWFVLLNEGLKYGIVKQAGAWYNYGESKWQGQDKMLSTISKTDYENLKQAIVQKWQEEFEFLNSVGKEVPVDTYEE